MNLLQLENKNIVVMGVANERSIAWGVAKRLLEVGANVIFTYRKERSKGKIEKLLTAYEDKKTAIVDRADGDLLEIRPALVCHTGTEAAADLPPGGAGLRKTVLRWPELSD